jgi:hypothetical protein
MACKTIGEVIVFIRLSSQYISLNICHFNHNDRVGSDDMLLGTASGGPSGQAGNNAVTQVLTQDTASGSPSGQAGNDAVTQGTTSGGPSGQSSSHVVLQGMMRWRHN